MTCQQQTVSRPLHSLCIVGLLILIQGNVTVLLYTLGCNLSIYYGIAVAIYRFKCIQLKELDFCFLSIQISKVLSHTIYPNVLFKPGFQVTIVTFFCVASGGDQENTLCSQLRNTNSRFPQVNSLEILNLLSFYMLRYVPYLKHSTSLLPRLYLNAHDILHTVHMNDIVAHGFK